MSKKLTVGNDNVTSLYVGSQKVKKIYAGSELVYESTPPVMPMKGDVITSNFGGTLGTANFRVLSITDTTATILCFTYFDKQWDTNDNYTYHGSSLDIFFEETLYPSFKTSVKNAIIPVEIWQRNMSTSSGSRYYYVKSNNSASSFRILTTHYGRPLYKHVYEIGIEEIISYFNATTSMSGSDTTLRYNDIKTMVNVTTVADGTRFWTRSGGTTNTASIETYNLSSGDFAGNDCANTYRAYFICKIDLSKISFSIN